MINKTGIGIPLHICHTINFIMCASCRICKYHGISIMYLPDFVNHVIHMLKVDAVSFEIR